MSARPLDPAGQPVGSPLDPTTPAGAAHLARLARLALGPDELAGMASHLARLLEHVAVLEELATDGVPATLHDEALPPERLRADEARPGLTRDEALASAPRRGPDGFEVPAVLSVEG